MSDSAPAPLQAPQQPHLCICCICCFCICCKCSHADRLLQCSATGEWPRSGGDAQLRSSSEHAPVHLLNSNLADTSRFWQYKLAETRRRAVRFVQAALSRSRAWHRVLIRSAIREHDLAQRCPYRRSYESKVRLHALVLHAMGAQEEPAMAWNGFLLSTLRLLF